MNEDIAVIVEHYRVKLGLLPWEEWAEKIGAILLKNHGLKNTGNRRTGRTQLGILRAIAMCEQRYASVLAISAEPPPNLNYCLDMARETIAKLGLQIRVTKDYPGCSGGELAVSYVDHNVHLPHRAW